jgi:hypothetical protein
MARKDRVDLVERFAHIVQIVSRTIETTVARVVLLYFVYRWQDP